MAALHRRVLIVVACWLGLYTPGLAKPGTPAWSKRPARREPPDAGHRAPRRIGNDSGWFTVGDTEVGLFMNYTGMPPDGEQLVHLEIGDKAIDMIRRAERVIVASVFLFDSIYAEDDVPVRDIVRALTDLLVARKAADPDLRVAVILDPSHKAYGHRVSPAEQRFRDAGIDVFYSDLLAGLRRGGLLGIREGLGHARRWLRWIPRPGRAVLEEVLFCPGRLRVRGAIDGEPLTLAMVANSLLMKANHRKLLVADSPGGDLEALVASANPHNPSVRSPNHALSVRGAPARHIYHVLREDIRHCIRLGGGHVHWGNHADAAYRAAYLDRQLPEWPPLPPASLPEQPIQVRFVTEAGIARAVRERLRAVQADDEIRIQMFYLSYRPILEELVRASRVVRRPIRVLLDPNKDSFNRQKDGTPNRQVAHRFQRRTGRGGGLEIRWYSTHGEQNHAKSMSVTHPDPSRSWLITGSGNWTGRNLAGVNMEADLAVAGSARLNREFNDLFDRLWTNRGGIEHSLDADAFPDHAGYWKWILGEAPFFYSMF